MGNCKSGFLVPFVALLYACGGGGGGGNGAPVAQAPSVSVGPASGSEAGDPPEAVFPVTLSASASVPVTVGYRSEPGTAAAGADFVAIDGTLTVPAGSRAAEIRVSLIDDDEAEGDETFEIRLSNPVNATLATAVATGTIVDDDESGSPELSVGPASVAEGAGARLVFPVTLSGPAADEVTVAFRTEDGTAAADEDYVAAAGTLTIPAGVSSAEIVVDVLDDANSEAAETVLIRLSDPMNATLVTTSATGTITDDDAPPPTAGLDSRPSNTTCLAPERAPGGSSAQVVLEPAFPDLPSFNQPTGLVQAPGGDARWYLLEKTGRVRVFPDDPAARDAPVWLDISAQVNVRSEGGLLGLAFDPDWPVVAEVYVSYTGNSGGGMRSVVSRFVPDEPVSPSSWREEQLITVDQDFDNHNGGHIAFDGGGRLILGLGDGGSGGDPNNRAQDTTRLLGSFLRLDVRGVPFPAPRYRIPADNPFAGNPACGPAGNAQSCPEILAWGFRNPWRWSIDPATGVLWAGDVGQGAWEEVDIVEAGGNYGWDCREGAHDFQPANCSGDSLVEPVAEYSHSLGNSITGGYVYRGTRVPALTGRYVFGDFGSGRIWALSDDGNYALEELVDSSLNVSSFAQAADGEIYVVNFGGVIRRLGDAGAGPTDPVPDLLSETGCTLAGDATQPAAGLVPYTLNAPFWSDGADKQRWIGLPDGAVIEIDGAGDWQFPPGSVLMKQFALAGRTVETRLLMRHPDGEWAGYTYAWDDTGTDATRVRGGLVRNIAGQDWIYPSESQCLECHTRAAGVALGPETAQLNGDLTYPSTGRTANQLVTLDHIGFLADPLPGSPEDLPALTNPADSTAPLDLRARAYLHTNCSQCHRPGGPTPVDMDLRWTVSLSATNTCDVFPSAGGGGIRQPRLIAPGDATRSVIVDRMARRDVRGMPPIASVLVDDDGVGVVSSWINSLSGCN